MRRKLFNIAGALSLVACAVMAVLFGLGRTRFGWHFGRQRLIGNWYYQIYDSRDVGCIGLKVYHDWPTPDVGPPLGPNLNYTPEVSAWFFRLPNGAHLRKLGFGYDHDTSFEMNSTPSWIAVGRYISVSVPFWAAWAVCFMTIPFAVAMGRRAVARGRRAVATGRIKRGLCVVCGYDIRATPKLCPECGAVPKPPRDQPMLSTDSQYRKAVRPGVHSFSHSSPNVSDPLSSLGRRRRNPGLSRLRNQIQRSRV